MTKQKPPFVTMSNIEELEIEWLLEPYLPRGALVALEGNPGQGKSTFCAALVGAITGEHPLPFGKIGEPGNVLLFCAEDDPARVLKRRLKANGADLSRVRIQQVPSAFDERGLDLMRTEMVRRPPAVVIIDPFVAYLDSDTDLNNAAEMTRFLNALDELAREFNSTILLVRHLRKSEADHSLHRGLGSIAISGRVRGTWTLGRNPDDPEIRAVAHAKSSWAPEGPTILFEIRNARGTSVVKWRGVSTNLTADDLIARPPYKRGRQDDERDAAKRFIQAELDRGPVAKIVLEERAEGRSISKMTLRRAADDLNILKFKKGKVGMWKLGG